MTVPLPGKAGETFGEDAVFELSGVYFSYKGEDTLKNISLRISRGESLGIVGESGSGKTTLLLLLLKLFAPRKGAIAFYGSSLADMDRRAVRLFRTRVQPVFQDPFLSLDPSQRVRSIIGEPLDSLNLARDKAEKEQKIAAALRSVGLEDDAAGRFPPEFSGGQRQRIAIARALVTNPEVLIADEPVSALDIITKTEILSLLHTLKENKNFTLVMVSHDLPAVADIAGRILVLDKGEIIEDAPARDILTAPKHRRTRLLVESAISLGA
jgi:peptide/nickel transport system ATP-binding protein